MEDLGEKIQKLKQERRAVILAHVYEPPEIQEIADFTGDSFVLSQRAAATDARVIVFCGVRFMAETANILSPEKITLLPAVDAGCQMFDDGLEAQVRRARQEHPGACIVSYVNTPASVKALSDICCTSANAVEVVQSLPENREIIFLPDGNLASYVQEQTGRDILCWPGGCPVHGRLSPEELAAARQEHPRALVLMHPECGAALRRQADYVGGTMGIVRYARQSPAREFIVATEQGVLYPLRQQCPDKRFYMASRRMLCVNMKKTSLEKVCQALETLEPRIQVPEKVRQPAAASLTRMLEIKGR